MSRTAEIYTKPNCGYCVRAKALFAQEGISYTEIDAVANKETLVERVTKDSGRPPMTLPQIYLDGTYVGGYTELAKRIAAEKNA
jgi:glutaredoxin 3